MEMNRLENVASKLNSAAMLFEYFAISELLIDGFKKTFQCLNKLEENFCFYFVPRCLHLDLGQIKKRKEN
jgi:hypothetical protein